MANNIDGIVKCTIDLNSPAVSEESYSGLLIIGPGPKNGKIEGVKIYQELAVLTNSGFTETDPVYRAVQTAFAQSPKPEKIYVATVAEGEEPTATVERAMGTDGWYFILPAGIEHTKYNALAVYTEATEKLLGITLAQNEENPILQEGLMRTHVWRLAGNQTTAYDPYLHVAICARVASYTPGSETWAFKSLSLITAGVFDETDSLDAKKENYYVCIAKKNITQGGKVLGDEWIDIIRFRDWLKNKIQMNCFNVFVQNRKVPFIDPGISLLESAVIAALKEGQENGGISPDSYDEDGNKVPGYETSVPLASKISAEQKKSRNLPNLKWSAHLGGAIHIAEVNGTLGY